jgi:hypothetical protein
MENHPIPQDVTGFKFRLIGSITLKQFLYLLGAGAIALVFYLLPITPFIKFPLMLFSGLIGMAFAFVPIEGRPLDKMLYNFAKAIPAENQFLYHKRGDAMIFFSFVPPAHAKPTATQVQSTQASEKAKLFNQLSKTYFRPDREEVENIQNISQLFQEGAVSQQGFTSRVYNADAAPVKPSTPQAPEEIKTIPEKMVEPHTPTPAPSAIKPAPLPKVEPEVALPTQPVIKQQAPQETPATPPLQPTTSAPQATQAPAQYAASNGVYTPNVIQGLVKDPRGKPLPHVVIEVLDSNQIPVRAFRTTQDGGFKSVTPLPNGTYTIHLEDSLKKQNFSDVKVELTGQILNPIEIFSVDQREELRRELFGGTATNG